MRAYSSDLRERVVRAVAQGIPKSVVARTFSVSVAAVTKYVALQRAARSLVPGKSTGRPQAITPNQYPDLERHLEEDPGATLAEHVARWETSPGVRMHLATMDRAIRRLGWTSQKRRWQRVSRTSVSASPFAPRSRPSRSTGSLPSTSRPPPLP
jgi:transposase